MKINLMYGSAFVLCSMAISPAFSRSMKATTFRPETVQTSTRYDSASRKLTIVCDRASRGVCRFALVDGERTRKVALRSTARLIISDVSGKARLCAMGDDPGSACNPIPIMN